MSKDNSIARRGSGTFASNTHAGRRITRETHEDRIKREKDLVSYSPYGYKDTVKIENELGKRRYLLRRMKQNVRQEFRAAQYSDLKESRTYTYEDLRLREMATIKIHVQECTNLQASFKQVKDNEIQNLSNSYVEVYYQGPSHKHLAWNDICHVEKSKKSSNNFLNIFNNNNKYETTEPPKKSVHFRDDRDPSLEGKVCGIEKGLAPVFSTNTYAKIQVWKNPAKGTRKS